MAIVAIAIVVADSSVNSKIRNIENRYTNGRGCVIKQKLTCDIVNF